MKKSYTNETCMSHTEKLSLSKRDVRDMIQSAFMDLGGLQRLVEWANDPSSPGNLGTFYTQIWSKIIPKEVQAKIDTNQRMNIVWDNDSQLIEDYEPEDSMSVTDMVMSEAEDDE